MDITKLSIQELKAMGFDAMLNIETNQRALTSIVAEIKNRSVNKEPEKPE